MDRYPVSPDDCLVLLAIRETSSLREAARLLGCDPAGLLRKVQRLAKDHGLLQKVRGRWTLTASAQPLVTWTQESILGQRRAILGQELIRIASTAWFAERVLIPDLRLLGEQFSGQTTLRLSTPGQGFESALLGGDCDFVVACHPPENPSIAHKQIQREPWSIVIAPASSLGRKRNVSLKDLKDEPFILHSEANPNALIPVDLPFDIRSSLSIDNLVGIRSAVRNRLGWSFVPTALVADEIASGEITQVGERYELDRKICLWWVRGSFEGKKRLPSILTWVRKACQKI